MIKRKNLIISGVAIIAFLAYTGGVFMVSQKNLTETLKKDETNTTNFIEEMANDSSVIETESEMGEWFKKLDEENRTKIVDACIYYASNRASQITFTNDEETILKNAADGAFINIEKIEDENLKKKVEDLKEDHLTLRYLNENISVEIDYALDELRKDYDYVVVDTNSSIFHVSSFPILQRAKECFYVLNLDFNNVRNNLRYKNVLKELGISDKVKYILNENIENTKEFWEQGVEDEELNFTAEDIENKYFTLVAKVPILPKTVFLNRLYEGTPVVLDSNKKEVTNKAKLEIMKIANSICPMDDEMTKLEKIIVDRENGKKGFFSKLFEKKEKIKEKKGTESDDE